MLRGNLRFKKVRSDRYENPSGLSQTVYVEIMRFLGMARIPLDVAQDALSMAQDEIRDKFLSDNPSWAESAEARKLTSN